jgi:DNA-binding transcriptional ArsR family regulator
MRPNHRHHYRMGWWRGWLTIIGLMACGGGGLHALVRSIGRGFGLRLRPWWLIYNRMVVDPLTDAKVDRLFHALADATRRDIVVRAAAGNTSVSALARCYPMSVTAIQKHVGVLESAGLIRKERRGREQIVTTEGASLAAARQILDRLEAMWRERLDRFGEVLSETPEGDQT